jgi:hypothetical protein
VRSDNPAAPAVEPESLKEGEQDHERQIHQFDDR